MRWTWTAVLALVAGCNGIQLDDVVKQHGARTRVAAEPPGVHCAHGGSAVLSGLDLNDNDVLDDGEVTRTEYVCATALTRMTAEPAGPHCALGGQAIQTGVDVDGSGALEDAEVTATDYLCATAVPDVLVRTQEVRPGDACPHGGQLSRAGHDANGNGELEDGEVTREVYGCMTPATVVARVRNSEPPPFNCAGQMTSVEAGLDSDRDGELDDAERRTGMNLCADAARVVVALFTEPAGAQCPAGGTWVVAGEDTDRDGKLDELEVVAARLVCQPLHTYVGDYWVTTAADLAALQGISHLQGHLFISGTQLTEVVLPGLSVVEGQVLVTGNSLLTRLELPGLRFVGQDLEVSSQPLMETLVLGSALSGQLWVEQYLRIRSNPRLATLGGLDQVTPRLGLELQENDALDFVDGQQGFSAIQSLADTLRVSGNDSLHALPFPNLQQVGGTVEIVGNQALRSLSGTHLYFVGSDLWISDNDLLQDLSGMNYLQAINVRLIVSGNDSLRTTEGLPGLARVGGLSFSGNSQLEWVGDMPALRSIEFQLDLSFNPKLRGLRNLDGLRYFSQLTLVDNPLLTELSPLSRATYLESLKVQRCPGLTSLGVLAGLREVAELNLMENDNLTRFDLGALQKVSKQFFVTHNPKLPTCRVTSLADAVYTGNPSLRRITNNDDTATCGN
ncbi:DUF7151 family protein [Pyxidicoccus sp. MSG2]|uniref:DUF7151 family protein n=1 Tax=Pyxidicoccus sp. MSG2 TaxID=2996790 RepID=UPI00227200C7|nr:hypothetical protein [Pyxidicoccus sp. MSG2]MCY1019497.1 hypothetical protein [Pyxidicoccus sp. MSG2]